MVGETRALAGRVVLVAEDDDDLRDVARAALEERLGVRVLEAADGDAALSMIQAERPALVILDLMLPKVHGWKIVRQVRSDPTTRDLPVIALSGTGDRWGALQAGCNEYVNKPFLIDELVGLARRWLAAPPAAR